jgi:hypothetical protein
VTVQSLPWAIQGQSHSAEIGRNVLAAMFGAPVAALVEAIGITTAGGAHGVVGSGDLAVTQRGAGANMSVDVAAGRAVIRSTEASSLAAGAYTFLNDATVNLSISAADATNPRIDLVIAQVRDSNYSGANTDARLAVVTGTPAASPSPPAVPDSCVVLAQVAVAALASSITNANITDKRTFAYALGGLAKYAGSTFRPSGASLFEGLLALDTTLNRLEIGNDTPALSSLISPAYGALTSWTPTVTQSGPVTVTVTYARYQRIGRKVKCWFKLDVTGSGTAANAVIIGGLPFTAASSGFVVGAGEINDVSVPSRFGALLFLGSTTTIEFHSVGSTANDNRLGVTSFTAGLASGDIVDGCFEYEAASDA